MSQVAGKGKSLMKALSGKGNNPEDPDRIGDRDVLASDRRRKQLARQAALQREEERLRREAVAAGAGPCGPTRDLQLARSTLPHADDDDDHNNNPDNVDTDEETDENDEPPDVYQDRRGGRALPFPQLPGPAYLEGPCEGGPQNYEFMRWFRSHIAMYIWEEYERRETTRCESRTKALEDYRGPQDNTMIARLKATCLYHLRDCFLKRMNKNLMLAFVERWQPETNSFHMPWGEMTITLHDVAFIQALRLDGPPVSEIRPVEECSQSLASVLGVGLMDTNEMFRNKGVGWFQVRDQLTLPSTADEKKMKGYLMFLLGSVLFVDKTACNMKPWWIHFTNDLDNVGKYSWASACLANMYRQLGIATCAGMNSLCGCVILLLCWIFEYFPCFRQPLSRSYAEFEPRYRRWAHGGGNKTTLQECRKKLDAMTERDVSNNFYNYVYSRVTDFSN
ncbi:PREDICTED: serine/threonine-protein phosphatase 7 long form homolog [Erythranthe guttata]|uniref:serine/threonine-protein phosphatase 7 long form homolog n=1 Tax=Erythranthe guttata TaxID=4155 RepID=UPI00064DE361|nr:PREDICTED: serine/threonine-protein phosphatase 7 long form homolog [Erythranthe guttata]|eukprot:XP_012854484.1 PREDICTED: serine/threonine-protein phosphatase 7 long form homolog [Erythranthe guttata]